MPRAAERRPGPSKSNHTTLDPSERAESVLASILWRPPRPTDIVLASAPSVFAQAGSSDGRT
ncbi:hypothetical protein BC628DRAFT_1418039 [Trametes gibbosa]|nr:hypothetical protein BC628DRAFT_1418039 [Trametes gibbosa]